MNESQFYLVWSDNGGSPTVKHQNYESAKKECERLTRQNGGTFHVLAHVATAKRNDVIYEEVNQIPF